jgi:hypothetical protein
MNILKSANGYRSTGYLTPLKKTGKNINPVKAVMKNFPKVFELSF